MSHDSKIWSNREGQASARAKRARFTDGEASKGPEVPLAASRRPATKAEPSAFFSVDFLRERVAGQGPATGCRGGFAATLFPQARRAEETRAQKRYFLLSNDSVRTLL